MMKEVIRNEDSSSSNVINIKHALELEASILSKAAPN